MPPDPRAPRRTELLVLAGLPRDTTERIAGLLLADPGTVVVGHDLRDVATGLVRRRVRTSSTDTRTDVRLAHGCVSCTLREDLLPGLLRHAGTAARVVLHLDPVLEPEQVCWALAHVLADTPDGGRAVVTDVLDLRGVVTAVDSPRWLDDATGDAELDDRDVGRLPDDERTVAQVVTGQAEFADLLVLGGTAPGWTLARTHAALARLAPTARRATLAAVAADPGLLALHDLPADARRGRVDDVHAPLLRGAPPLDEDCGLALHVFTARRPFHPERLHEAIDVLLDGVVRTRGRVWLATRPADVLWLESAGGGLQIGHAGSWLADTGPDVWEAADPQRVALAAAGWDERFGDRAQDVVVLSDGARSEPIDAALHAALLTDDELAGGPDSWAALPDPFGWWHTDPCDTTAAHAPAPNRSDRGGHR
ncbi:ribosome hibernation factor-recruiting GTPase MRF [Pseudonocardia sp. N23]|uniref:ribosome hibernation factor-recruiting GTPase MRF n=1 Tax=Pseudonocardia sp. N23 TaxID=1987376 RepID=UPI000BFB5555|nr:GTP-binding protein [Pseudonocardia sp. N23]GAY10247.1 putative metal chaperone [Pseudonocardia sp. N23]